MRVKCRDASASAHRWTVGRCSPGKCSEGPPVPCAPPPSCRLAQASARACLPRAQRVFMAGPSPSRELVLVLLLLLLLQPLLLLRFPLRCLSALLRSLAACLPQLSSQLSALSPPLLRCAALAPLQRGEARTSLSRRRQQCVDSPHTGGAATAPPLHSRTWLPNWTWSALCRTHVLCMS